MHCDCINFTIFENLLTLQFFKFHLVMFDIMLGRHICLTGSSGFVICKSFLC